MPVTQLCDIVTRQLCHRERVMVAPLNGADVDIPAVTLRVTLRSTSRPARQRPPRIYTGVYRWPGFGNDDDHAIV
jgi:hypothetical protein